MVPKWKPSDFVFIFLIWTLDIDFVRSSFGPLLGGWTTNSTTPEPIINVTAAELSNISYPADHRDNSSFESLNNATDLEISNVSSSAGFSPSSGSFAPSTAASPASSTSSTALGCPCSPDTGNSRGANAEVIVSPVNLEISPTGTATATVIEATLSSNRSSSNESSESVTFGNQLGSNQSSPVANQTYAPSPAELLHPTVEGVGNETATVLAMNETDDQSFTEAGSTESTILSPSSPPSTSLSDATALETNSISLLAGISESFSPSTSASSESSTQEHGHLGTEVTVSPADLEINSTGTTSASVTEAVLSSNQSGTNESVTVGNQSESSQLFPIGETHAPSPAELLHPTGEGTESGISTLSTTIEGDEHLSTEAVSQESTVPSSSSTGLATIVTLNETGGQNGGQGQAPIDCSKLDSGFYGNPHQPCDTKFYICTDRSQSPYEQSCPAKLYYDPEEQRCDMWAHIPACSGSERPTLAAFNESKITLSPVPLVIDCHNKNDGNYPDPESTPKANCSNRYFICVGDTEVVQYCPRGLYYDPETNQCDQQSHVFICSGNRSFNGTPASFSEHESTVPALNYSCSEKADGYYVEECGNVYYGCSGGQPRQFHCPHGLVFDSEWLSCEVPSNAFICTGKRRPSTTHSPQTNVTLVITTPSPLDCHGRPDGVYRDPENNCSRIFYFCAHGSSVRNTCPGNLYYDSEFKRCDLWTNIFDCSGSRPTTTLLNITAVPTPAALLEFDCSKLNDGNYADPKKQCSKFFYICANMETTKQECPSGLFYNPDSNSCDAWANIFACSHATRTVSASTVLPTNGSTEVPEFNCTLKSDGVYLKSVNACSGVFYRCVGGSSFKFNCPGGLFYDVSTDRCDLFEYVFACSGITRPPTVVTISLSSETTTVKAPIDCSQLGEGDFSDPSASKCTHHFYTCSFGLAIRRSCPSGTYYDAELSTCDFYNNVPDCSGKPRQNTTSTPAINRTSGPAPQFDCTRLHDGNYASDNCTGKYWSCVGGTTFPRSCPAGFVYDDEEDVCQFRHLLPGCGGKRLESPTTSVPAPTVAGLNAGFDCKYLPDGNYGDPEAADGCSSVYFTCANGQTTRINCQAGLYYDIGRRLCDSHYNVPSCVNGSISNSTTKANEQAQNASLAHGVVSASISTSSSSTEASAGVFQPSTMSSSEISTSSSQISNVSLSASSSSQAPTSSSQSTLEPFQLSTESSQTTTSSQTETSTQSTLSSSVEEAGNVSLAVLEEGINGTSTLSSPVNATVTAQGSEKPPDPLLTISLQFNCAYLQDGNYASGICTAKYWSCVGGTTFPRSCPAGFVYDNEEDMCQSRHLVPACGGKRVSPDTTNGPAPTVAVLTSTVTSSSSREAFESSTEVVQPSATPSQSTPSASASESITESFELSTESSQSTPPSLNETSTRSILSTSAEEVGIVSSSLLEGTSATSSSTVNGTFTHGPEKEPDSKINL